MRSIQYFKKHLKKQKVKKYEPDMFYNWDLPYIHRMLKENNIKYWNDIITELQVKKQHDNILTIPIFVIDKIFLVKYFRFMIFNSIQWK